MKCLLIVAAGIAIALARPEKYRESEEFQFSRHSSDEGSKAGYYGAQRGNMGGNYEKAHNMDYLAQNQMSSVVKQVDGELGDAANARSGKIYTAANSHGVYGSGNYDLSNLQGRNFHEGVHYGENQAASSLHSANYDAHSSSALHSAGYTNSAHNSRYQATQNSGASNALVADNLQAGYGSRASGYEAKSGYETKSGYSSYGSNAQTHLIGAGEPARIVIRPGSTVVIPVAAHTTYDASHSIHDTNAINTETEVLNNAHVNIRPASDAKQYESSYNYRKEWEKHDTVPGAVPLAIPTVSPFPKNSELYEDAQLHTSGNNYHAADAYSGYNANSEIHSASQSKSNAYSHGGYGAGVGYGSANLVADVKPKSYESSYQYHKSWERQGDPYVIYPATNAETSARLTDTSRTAHEYGSQQHSRYTQGQAIDCDPCSHVRYGRSADYEGQETQQLQDFTQQSQNIEDLGQQTQQLQDFSQYSQNLEIGQQTQQLNDFGQQSQNEDLGQQTQQLQDFSQQSQGYEDFGQQTQDLRYYGQSQKPQHTPTTASQQSLRTQHPKQTLDQNNQFESQQNFNQRSENFGQQTQNQWNLEQQSQNTWGQTEQEDKYQTQGIQRNDYPYINQQTQATLNNFNTQSRNNSSRKPLNNFWDKFDGLAQSSSVGQDQSTLHRSWNQTHNFNGTGSFSYGGQQSQNVGSIYTSTSSFGHSTSTGKTISRPHHGRGDIDEDPEPFTTQKTFKTPEELEALSLTKVTTATPLNQHSNNGLTQQQNLLHKQNNFSTSGVNYQQHNYNQFNTVKQTQNSQQLEETQQLQNFGQQSQNLEDYGQETQQLQNFGQQSENLQDYGQETQQLQNFGQQSQNLQDFGQQTQQLQDFGQQSQNLEEYGQQTQPLNSFGQNQQKIQDLRRLTARSSNPYATDNFYDNRRAKENEEKLEVVPLHNVNPVTSTKEPIHDAVVEQVTLVPRNAVPEETTVPTTTVKPGFWKNVGNKVSSWFK